MTTRAAVIATWTLASLGVASLAHADDLRTIRDRRTPIAYQLEIEPHVLAGTEPPGPGAGSGLGFGARGSYVILPDGFIRNVNDSIAVSVGVDIGRYYGSWAIGDYRDQCLHFEEGPADTRVCTEVTSGSGTYTYVYLPMVMQWNFWLTEHWSAFGEPGLAVYFAGDRGVGVIPSGFVGGRYHIANGITLTGRIGYPSVSLGLSFTL